MNFQRKSSSGDVQIDITSLIDIIFILLIFFLVTASFDSTSEQAMQVNLPEGSSQGEIDVQEELTIFIGSDGNVGLYIGDDAQAEGVNADELLATLQRLHRDIGARPVFLRGDENVRYGEVVRVLDACREAGFKRVFNVIRAQP